jgi:outer membrane protein assembly factor BamB
LKIENDRGAISEFALLSDFGLRSSVFGAAASWSNRPNLPLVSCSAAPYLAAMPRCALMVCRCLFLLPILASARDWPQWAGTPGKNLVSDEKGLPTSFVPGDRDPQGGGRIILATASNVLWGVRTGTLTYGSPTVAGGKVFVATCENRQGFLKCLDARNGNLLWQYTEPHRQVPRRIDGNWDFMFGRITPGLGICSTPAVEGDRVYFVNHRCEVVCLDANGGPAESAPAGPDSTAGSNPPAGPAVRGAKIVWKFDMWEETGVRPADGCNGSPLIDGDLIYACTSNGVDRDADIATADNRQTPAPNAPSLIVLEKKSGRLVATDDATSIGPRLMHGQWSSPSLATVQGRKLIFFGGGDGVCYAFEALTAVPARPVKLKTVWSFDCIPPEYRSFGGLDWASHYSRGDKRLKQSLNKTNDSMFVGMSEIIATPVPYKNRVYVAIGRDPEHGRGRGALWCIDATQRGDITRTGRIWSYQGLDRTLSTVSISDGLLYIADVAGRLHCLDAEMGEVYWVHETKSEVWSSTLVADGKIYLPSLKHLWVLATGREKKVLAQISLGGPMYALPVAANGTLYLSSRTYLWAVGQGKNPP